ncbi:MAG TPA: hypothetical protein VGP20_05270 [Steroidobacteraceae bacterium]|jgi:hypothetical protein|nr:hypothetical protein [Steroidobacteraceae bacterium]
MNAPRTWLLLARLACALGALTLLLIGVARADPNGATGPAAAGAAEHAQIELPVAILERYTGYYQIADRLVLTITRQGQQLLAQLTGQPAAEIYPETAASFVYKVVNARIDFIPDPPAQITALVLHQRGTDHVAQRIDAAQAQQIQAAVANRVQDQSPAPGSEQAARQMLAGVAADAPDYAAMTPELALATRQQLPQLRASLAALGAVQSIKFEGVGNQGWDLYLVRHEHGSSQVRILMNPNGIIAGALISAGP